MENWQAIAITISVAGLAIAVGTLLFKAGSWKGSIDGWRDSVDGWRGSIDEWRDSIDQWKGSVDETLNEIREDIRKIFDRLPPDVTGEGSPLTLTDLGKSISEELEAKGWAKSMATTLKDEVTGLEPYEIHEFSESYMAKIFEPTEEQSAKIGRCAYDHALKREKVLEVMMIELRDALLELDEKDGIKSP